MKNNPLRFSDVVGLAITGTIIDSKVLLSDISFDIQDWGTELRSPIEPGKLPGLGPQVLWIDMMVGGKVRFLIHCKETECQQTKREGYVETAVPVPNIIPYTHHQEAPFVSWMYSVPYNMGRVATAVEPMLKKLARLKGLNVPLLCRMNPWMPNIPFSWSNELPLSP